MREVKSIGEVRPDIGPAVIGFRERRIAKLEWEFEQIKRLPAHQLTLEEWGRITKEIEIQKCYLQHENIGAI